MTDVRTDPEFPEAPIDAVAAPLRKFIHTETAGGGILLAAAIIAILIANSDLRGPFEAFWTTASGAHFGRMSWDFPLRHWINDGLMTIFFLVVGLEIKREIAFGELSEVRAAVLPVAGALGGMAVPAVLYLVLASGPQAGLGWGVVMATDIAFVVGCMALLGRRVPNSLRIFILALAIIDDIGAITVIAVGYNHGFHPIPFFAAVLCVGVAALMQRLGVRAMLAYWAIGLFAWAAAHESGIHPTITGVALGLLTPTTPWVEHGRLERFLEWAKDARPDPGANASQLKPKRVRQGLARAAVESMSPQQRLEDALHPWSAFLILPLFALANAGVPISVQSAFEPISLATVGGLVIGKPIGIFAAAWLAVKTGLARKSDDVNWPMLLGAGALGGIGFTMSLFIADLAFTGTALQSAKLGILAASVVSGVVGLALLLMFTPRR